MTERKSSALSPASQAAIVPNSPSIGALAPTRPKTPSNIAALSTFYGDGAPDWDYKNLADKSQTIRLVNPNVEMAYAERRSSRTGQQHGLGGFVGSATYEGDLADFIQLLRVAEWTGVGRHTPWGNGAIRLEAIDNLRLIAGVKLNKSKVPEV